jgi:hydrogenase maturation protease
MPSPAPAASHGCLILCLGNDVLKDDGVGLCVAGLLDEDRPEGAIVRKSGMAGLYLLDELVGFDRAIVVDAIRTGAKPPGHVWSLRLDALHSPAGPSPHSVGLPAVLALGRASGLSLPGKVHLVAVEVEDMETVEEGLTPAVRGAVGRAAQAVREVARKIRQNEDSFTAETQRAQRKI